MSWKRRLLISLTAIWIGLMGAAVLSSPGSGAIASFALLGLLPPGLLWITCWVVSGCMESRRARRDAMPNMAPKGPLSEYSARVPFGGYVGGIASFAVLSVAISTMRDRSHHSWWIPAAVVGGIGGVATLVWLLQFLLSRYGGEAGRKLTRPIDI